VQAGRNLLGMTRTRIALSLTTVGLAGVLGLSGCGAGAPTASDVSSEAGALQAVGFDTGLAAAPDPSPSAAGHHKTRLRQYLRKNTLHGEVTVQGKDGVKTIVVQRGTVTAVSATGVSVKSTDGFTATWTFGDKVKIVQDKKAVAASAVKTGAEVGIAGTKDGSADAARLIAIK
jgi:hypothetical protein